MCTVTVQYFTKVAKSCFMKAYSTEEKKWTVYND